MSFFFTKVEKITKCYNRDYEIKGKLTTQFVHFSSKRGGMKNKWLSNSRQNKVKFGWEKRKITMGTHHFLN